MNHLSIRQPPLDIPRYLENYSNQREKVRIHSVGSTRSKSHPPRPDSNRPVKLKNINGQRINRVDHMPIFMFVFSWNTADIPITRVHCIVTDNNLKYSQHAPPIIFLADEPQFPWEILPFPPSTPDFSNFNKIISYFYV